MRSRISMYFSKANRPAEVSVQVVSGLRSTKLFVIARYPASCNVRRWTLRFPSVIRSRSLRSLNESTEVAAKDDMIAMRPFSCTMRSNRENASLLTIFSHSFRSSKGRHLQSDASPRNTDPLSDVQILHPRDSLFSATTKHLRTQVR